MKPEPQLDDLVDLGLRLLTGAPIDPRQMSHNRLTEALRAAQRYREFHEVDIRSLMTEAQRRRL